MQRRTFLLTSLLPALLASAADSSEIDPKQTFVLHATTSDSRPGRGCRPAAVRWGGGTQEKDVAGFIASLENRNEKTEALDAAS